MDEKELYSISEVAKRLQISSQAVYKRVANEKMKEYVQIINGKKYVNTDGMKILMEGKEDKEKTESLNQNDPKVDNLIQEVANQKAEIEELKRVVNELQKVVGELTTGFNQQQREISVRLLDLIDQQQQLQAMQLQAKQQPEQIVQQSKRGLLSRLWGK